MPSPPTVSAEYWLMVKLPSGCAAGAASAGRTVASSASPNIKLATIARSFFIVAPSGYRLSAIGYQLIRSDTRREGNSRGHPCHPVKGQSPLHPLLHFTLCTRLFPAPGSRRLLQVFE